MKVKRFEIKDPIFSFLWYVQIGGTQKSATDWYKVKIKIPNVEFKGESNDAASFSFVEGRMTGVLWFSEVPGGGWAGHEIYHLVTYFADQMKLPMGKDSQEILANYTEFMMRELGNRIWKKKR